MAGQIVRRLLLGIGTLVLVSGIVFFATNILPGDAARAMLGRSATSEAVAALQRELGMDRPIAVQYLSWIGGVLRGDLGTSYVSHLPVWDGIGQRFYNTLLLLTVTSLVAIPLSFIIGLLMATRPNGPFDTVMNTLLISGAAIPEFVTAIILVLLLSTYVFHLLPPTSIVQAGQGIFQNPQVLILPVMTLTLAVIPYLGRMVRASLIDALASEYVTTARLKGLRPRTILLRHALRNSLVPAIQGSALSLAYLLGGTVVVEVIFQYPGLGSTLQQSVGQRDLFTIQAVVLIFSGGYVLFNIVADVLTIMVTPRLRS